MATIEQLRHANRVARAHGVRSLLSPPDSNPKIAKANAWSKYLTVCMHLAPADESGYEVCSHRSLGCTEACLQHAGRGGILLGDRVNPVKQARLNRTRFLFEARKEFDTRLSQELRRHVQRCTRQKRRPAVRLNALSDLYFGRVIRAFPVIQFYDYTKVTGRFDTYLRGRLPKNYDLTFSVHENNGEVARRFLERGARVAVVFDRDIPDTWHGWPVIPADDHDLTFLRPTGVVLGLQFKATNQRKSDLTQLAIASGFAQ